MSSNFFGARLARDVDMWAVDKELRPDAFADLDEVSVLVDDGFATARRCTRIGTVTPGLIVGEEVHIFLTLLLSEVSN